MADHLRPWKKVQRRFQDIETSKLKASEREALELQKTQYQDQIDLVEREIRAARKAEIENAGAISDLEARIDRTRGDFQRLDTERKFQKAELDSLRSFYDGMIDRGEDRRARAYMVETIVPAEERLLRITREFEAVEKTLNGQLAELASLRGNIEEKERKKESPDPRARPGRPLAGTEGGRVLTA